MKVRKYVTGVLQRRQQSKIGKYFLNKEESRELVRDMKHRNTKVEYLETSGLHGATW